MLLKDCPVGSVVDLASGYGDNEYYSHSSGRWMGTFEVMVDKNGSKYIVDKVGDKRDDICEDKNYQFRIIKPAPSTPKTITNAITLNGKTYKLKPHTEPRLTVIDGVTYEMEEI